MSYMERDRLSESLEKHFETIVGMLREGKVPHYEMVMDTEVMRFERYLKDNRFNYTKQCIFHDFTASYMFSNIKEAEPRRSIKKMVDEAYKVIKERRNL
jgi:hypothetical protein